MQNQSPPFGTIVAFGCLAAVAGTGRAATPSTCPPAATGRAAAERAWFGLAEELWCHPARVGAASGTTSESDLGDVVPRERLHRAAREMLRARAERVAAAGRVWETQPCGPLWRRACTTATIEPVAAACGLVLWSSGRSVHALRLRDGRIPWLPGVEDAEAKLFPRGVATAAAGAAPMPGPPPAVVGSRAYCVLSAGSGARRLACLDLSPTAEGRLAWIVDADSLDCFDIVAQAERSAAFDGPPVADHELCLVVVRSGPPREELALAALDARDGSPCWIARIGPARSLAGRDHAAGRRRACFAEDRVVLATHAGAIHAFDRDGTPAWRTPVPAGVAASSLAASSPSAPAAVFVGGRVVVALREARGIVALEPRRGGIAWHALDGVTVSDLLEPASGTAVIVSHRDDGVQRLVRLAVDSGRTAAGHEVVLGRLLGGSVVGSGSVFLPVLRRPAAPGADTIAIEVLDAETLSPRRPPLAAFPDTVGGPPGVTSGDVAVNLAVAGGRLVVAAGGSIVCLGPLAGHGADTGRSAR